MRRSNWAFGERFDESDNDAAGSEARKGSATDIGRSGHTRAHVGESTQVQSFLVTQDWTFLACSPPA